MLVDYIVTLCCVSPQIATADLEGKKVIMSGKMRGGFGGCYHSVSGHDDPNKWGNEGDWISQPWLLWLLVFSPLFLGVVKTQVFLLENFIMVTLLCDHVVMLLFGGWPLVVSIGGYVMGASRPIGDDYVLSLFWCIPSFFSFIHLVILIFWRYYYSTICVDTCLIFWDLIPTWKVKKQMKTILEGNICSHPNWTGDARPPNSHLPGQSGASMSRPWLANEETAATRQLVGDHGSPERS